MCSACESRSLSSLRVDSVIVTSLYNIDQSTADPNNITVTQDTFASVLFLYADLVFKANKLYGNSSV